MPIYIASFRIALEASTGAQLLELTHDLAAIAGTERAHQLDEKLRPIGERRRQAAVALAVVVRRRRQAAFDALALAEGERYGSLRAALAAGPKFFVELMSALGTRDGREIVRELEQLRAGGRLERDAEGRYVYRQGATPP